MRTTHITIAIVCATLVAITGMLAWLTAAGHDIQGIASVIVSAIVPTIASLIAVDQASRARAELEGGYGGENGERVEPCLRSSRGS